MYFEIISLQIIIVLTLLNILYLHTLQGLENEIDCFKVKQMYELYGNSHIFA